MTLWSERFELFAEHPAAVVGQEVGVLSHFTVLDGFAALTFGSVTVELSGPAELRGEARAPLRPGIYQPTVTPTAPGTYRGRFVIDGPVSGVVEGLVVEVYPDETTAHAAVPHDDGDHGEIEFLKEQQWGVPFGTAFATDGSIAPSIEVPGRVVTPPGGTAEVGPPVTGRLVAPRRGLARPWSAVKKGQVLAFLAPAPSSPEAAARANLAVAEAEARVAAARSAAKRAERLIRDEAISQREMEDARREVQVADEAVRAARRRSELYAGGGSGASRWPITAPIAGVLAEVKATPGATVSPGDVLFRIIDPKELWITARVPEQDAPRLRTDASASFRVAGDDAWRRIDLGGDAPTASVVAVGRTVHPVSRTVELIYGLRAPDPNLRVGGLVTVGLPVGAAFSGVVIPRTALLDQEGRSIVYVQVDGEHFVERGVRVGARAGERIGIESGLTAGERVVTTGAHLVRLADRAKAGGGHGHIH